VSYKSHHTISVVDRTGQNNVQREKYGAGDTVNICKPNCKMTTEEELRDKALKPDLKDLSGNRPYGATSTGGWKTFEFQNFESPGKRKPKKQLKAVTSQQQQQQLQSSSKNTGGSVGGQGSETSSRRKATKSTGGKALFGGKRKEETFDNLFDRAGLGSVDSDDDDDDDSNNGGHDGAVSTDVSSSEGQEDRYPTVTASRLTASKQPPRSPPSSAFASLKNKKNSDSSDSPSDSGSGSGDRSSDLKDESDIESDTESEKMRRILYGDPPSTDDANSNSHESGQGSIEVYDEPSHRSGSGSKSNEGSVDVYDEREIASIGRSSGSNKDGSVEVYDESETSGSHSQSHSRSSGRGSGSSSRSKEESTGMDNSVAQVLSKREPEVGDNDLQQSAGMDNSAAKVFEVDPGKDSSRTEGVQHQSDTKLANTSTDRDKDVRRENANRDVEKEESISGSSDSRSNSDDNSGSRSSESSSRSSAEGSVSDSYEPRGSPSESSSKSGSAASNEKSDSHRSKSDYDSGASSGASASSASYRSNTYRPGYKSDGDGNDISNSQGDSNTSKSASKSSSSSKNSNCSGSGGSKTSNSSNIGGDNNSSSAREGTDSQSGKTPMEVALSAKASKNLTDGGEKDTDNLVEGQRTAALSPENSSGSSSSRKGDSGHNPKQAQEELSQPSPALLHSSRKSESRSSQRTARDAIPVSPQETSRSSSLPQSPHEGENKSGMPETTSPSKSSRTESVKSPQTKRVTNPGSLPAGRSSPKYSPLKSPMSANSLSRRSASSRTTTSTSVRKHTNAVGGLTVLRRLEEQRKQEAAKEASQNLQVDTEARTDKDDIDMKAVAVGAPPFPGEEKSATREMTGHGAGGVHSQSQKPVLKNSEECVPESNEQDPKVRQTISPVPKQTEVEGSEAARATAVPTETTVWPDEKILENMESRIYSSDEIGWLPPKALALANYGDSKFNSLLDREEKQDPDAVVQSHDVALKHTAKPLAPPVKTVENKSLEQNKKRSVEEIMPPVSEVTVVSPADDESTLGTEGVYLERFPPKTKRSLQTVSATHVSEFSNVPTRWTIPPSEKNLSRQDPRRQDPPGARNLFPFNPQRHTMATDHREVGNVKGSRPEYNSKKSAPTESLLSVADKAKGQRISHSWIPSAEEKRAYRREANRLHLNIIPEHSDDSDSVWAPPGIAQSRSTEDVQIESRKVYVNAIMANNRFTRRPRSSTNARLQRVGSATPTTRIDFTGAVSSSSSSKSPRSSTEPSQSARSRPSGSLGSKNESYVEIDYSEYTRASNHSVFRPNLNQDGNRSGSKDESFVEIDYSESTKASNNSVFRPNLNPDGNRSGAQDESFVQIDYSESTRTSDLAGFRQIPNAEDSNIGGAHFGTAPKEAQLLSTKARDDDDSFSTASYFEKIRSGSSRPDTSNQIQQPQQGVGPFPPVRYEQQMPIAPQNQEIRSMSIQQAQPNNMNFDTRKPQSPYRNDMNRSDFYASNGQGTNTLMSKDPQPPPDAVKTDRRRITWIILILVVIFLVLAGGAVAATLLLLNRDNSDGGSPTLSPASSPNISPEALTSLVLSVSPGTEDALNNQDSPQSQALDWLETNPFLNTYSDERRLQRFVLATLFYATGGDSWTKNEGWLGTTNECDWYSSETQNDVCQGDSVMVDIDLRINSLAGTLPWEELGNILAPQLLRITFPNNNIVGSISTSIGKLTSLLDLDVENNGIAGIIPSHVGLMTSMQNLLLSDNSIEGTLPSELSRMTDLRNLRVSRNSLIGSIPSELGRLTNLQNLYLEGNDLVGLLPQEICDLNLDNLVVDCQSVICDCCSCSGESNPDFPTSPPVNSPVALSTSSPAGTPSGGNSPPITPTVAPATFGTPTNGENLKRLVLDAYPPGRAALEDPSSPQSEALLWLESSSNSAVTTEESYLQRYALATLYLATNGDEWIDNTSWLTNTNECSWKSTKSNSLGICDPLGRYLEINLESNNLRGELPPELVILSNSLNTFNVKGNDLVGPVPTFIVNMNLLESFDVSSNQLSGTIPGILSNATSLKQLSLFDNNLISTIPHAFGLLRSLEVLDLGSNQLTGTIPSSFGLLTRLAGLSVFGNFLSGTVPTEFSNLEGLELLYIDSNDFRAPLPSGICDLNLVEFWSDCEETQCLCCTTCCSDGFGCFET
jgi:Leucine rich repeat